MKTPLVAWQPSRW